MLPIIRTFSGREINPLDVKTDDIDIEDIAHALACINRFNGHSRKPVSVAQHSVYCARLCEGTPHELQALLHDAAEAYLGDVTKWLKATPEMAAFREVEDRLQARIFQKYDCPVEKSYEVEIADRIMVRFEGSKGFKGFTIDHPDYPPLTKEEIDRVGVWKHWKWSDAKEAFLTHFRLLGL